jgi:carbonic anhydrase
VRTDVARVVDASQLSSRIAVSGHVYDIATGLVTTIIPATAHHSEPPRNAST